MKLICVSALFLFFTACLPTKQFVKFANNSSTDSLMAKIYVLRPSYIGSLVPMKVYCNDKYIGVTGPGSYLCWYVNQGEYAIMSTTENKSYNKPLSILLITIKSL